MWFGAQILPALRRDHRFDDKGLRVRGKDMPRHPESPAFSTKSLITNSAMGLRQILPWQINKTFFIPQILPKSGLIPRFFGIRQCPNKLNRRLFTIIFIA